MTIETAGTIDLNVELKFYVDDAGFIAGGITWEGKGSGLAARFGVKEGLHAMIS